MGNNVPLIKGLVTKKELEVICKRANGKRYTEIAKELGITKQAVYYRIDLACARLEVEHRKDLIPKCVELGLLRRKV